MKEYIELTKNGMKKLNPAKVVAVAIADEGAMGDAGIIKIVNEDFKIYFAPFKDIQKESLNKMIGRPEDWKHLYTGFGNHLFVRPEVETKLLNYIKDIYDGKCELHPMLIHKHWYEALKEISSAK